MKIAGIIAEYNPFHRGHAYHIARTREMTGCDYVVVCMDGHFTQRGEAACMSKWARAKMALSCGADAVVEMPTLYAVRTADAFARSGVAILGGLGIDVLSFGSECDDVDWLNHLADIRECEPEAVSQSLRAHLAAGASHAQARGRAMAEYLNVEGDVLNRPNLILATEYIRAIRKSFPNMQILPVARKGDYHDESLGKYASASAIRAAVDRGAVAEAVDCLPEEVRCFAEFEKMHPMDDLLMYRLRSMDLMALSDLPDVSEGLECRVHKLCRQVGSRAKLLETLKCKRYTYARLSRILTYAVLDIDRALIQRFPAPEYARIIGVRAGAEPLLKALNRRGSLPVVISGKAIEAHPVFQTECRATDLWALLHDAPEKRLPGREFTEKFIRI